MTEIISENAASFSCGDRYLCVYENFHQISIGNVKFRHRRNTVDATQSQTEHLQFSPLHRDTRDLNLHKLVVVFESMWFHSCNVAK